MQPSSRNRPRGLRIGVVLGDTLIAEQVLERGAFSIGRRASCSVPLPLPGLPARWDLLTIDGRGAHLRLGPAMDVRLADGAAVRTRADLGGDGDGPLEVAIATGGRGKVSLGELKIMFHEIEVAPRAPLPRLPPELRATLADRIDRRLVAFAAASLALHVGVMAAARLNDPPADLTAAEQVMADYVEDNATVIDADELPDLPAPVPAPAPAPAASASQQPRPAPDQPAAPRPTGDRPRPSPSAPIATADPVGDAARAADLLFGADPGAGPLLGDTARRRPSGDLGQQLTDLADQHASASLTPGGDRELPRSDGPRLGTTTDPTSPTLPGQVQHTDQPRPEPDHVRVTLTPAPKPPPGEPSVDAILGKIRTTYMAGLTRCYKRAMAEGGALAGKVVIAFEVTERGAVRGPTATGVDDGLEQCVEGLMAGWKFNPVVDLDGDPTEVDVKVTLQLRPD